MTDQEKDREKKERGFSCFSKRPCGGFALGVGSDEDLQGWETLRGARGINEKRGLVRRGSFLNKRFRSV